MSAGQQVAVIALDDASWLGRWRTLPELEACEAEGLLWLRGPGSDSWARLPALARYVEDVEGRLIRPGQRVPLRRLPEGRWLPLVELLRVRPPAAALPAQHIAPVAWALVPSAAYREPALLMLPFSFFALWCLAAPSVRLRLLRFALGQDGQTCVSGKLLPSLPGEAWCVEKNIATPAGWALPPGITPQLVAQSMNLAPGELALMHPDATADRLPAEAFVDVSRSAIRASFAATPS
jgi:hypothetical protein